MRGSLFWYGSRASVAAIAEGNSVVPLRFTSAFGRAEGAARRRFAARLKPCPFRFVA
jgi:hypothetical protein